MNSSLSSIWKGAQKEIREKVGGASYETWFSSIRIKEKDRQTLVIETPDDFFKNWIAEHYQKFIEEIVTSAAKKIVNIELSVNKQLITEDNPTKPTPAEVEFNAPEQARNTSTLNSRFTFENFVIGPSNRFSCAAGLAVSESPAKAYNPLFIYGPVGLGKTHLIQAITHKIRQNHPGHKISYMSSEQFTNDLINAIRHRSTSEFRKKYREIDVLLIDDIQFIAGKESTQEEFFHTFNYLHDHRKQIIITSDRPPNEISKLEERLSSRFAWGLITDIQPPDFETRVAILRKKVESEPVKVPDDIILFIAEQIKTNIRELEGALIRVAAYSLLEDKIMTLEMAKVVLKDMVKESLKIITVETIQKAISEHYNLPLVELRSKKRNKNIVLPRQISIYLTRKLTHMSLPEIGSAFGGKDHTTVLHSCKKIEKMLEEDPTLKNTIQNLITALKQ